MVEVVADTEAALVLMHMPGTPQTMQQQPQYRNVAEDIAEFLAERARFAMDRGVARSRIVLDPGIGFGKVLMHNLDLLAQLGTFTKLGFPVMIGPSRKGFIGQLTNQAVQDRAWGTAGVVALAVEHGANILRVHDVAPMRDVVKVVLAISRRTPTPLGEQQA